MAIADPPKRPVVNYVKNGKIDMDVIKEQAEKYWKDHVEAARKK